MAPAQPEARRRARAARRPPGARSERLARARSAAARRRAASGAVELDPDQVGERRIAERPPALELAGEEPRGVVARRHGGSPARPGASVWTSTRPPRSPRPLRPASWATSAKVRSSARKSGKRRVASASRTTLRTTSGKSWPLATIWVPTSTPASARVEAPQDLEVAAGARGAVGVEPEDGQRRDRLAQQRRRAARCRRRGGPGDRAAVRARRGAARRGRSGGSESSLGVAGAMTSETSHRGAAPGPPAGPAGRGRATSRGG